jgi:hypothetical protein
VNPFRIRKRHRLAERGVDVDTEVARLGSPVPPTFRLRDPTGDSLVAVEQP